MQKPHEGLNLERHLSFPNMLPPNDRPSVYEVHIDRSYEETLEECYRHRKESGSLVKLTDINQHTKSSQEVHANTA